MGGAVTVKKLHTGAIKGMAIANIVVSAVYAICLALLMSLMLALGSVVVDEAIYGSDGPDSRASSGASYSMGAAFGEGVGLESAVGDAQGMALLPEGVQAAVGYGSGHGYGYGYGDDLDLDDLFTYGYGYDESADAIMAIYNAVIIIVMLIPLLLALLSVVAGVLVLINVKRPERLQFIMVWGIVGAVASGLACSLPCLVMFILIAVFANSDKAIYRAEAEGAEQVAYAPIGSVAPVVPVAGAASAQPASTANIPPAYASAVSMHPEVSAVPAQPDIQQGEQAVPQPDMQPDVPTAAEAQTTEAQAAEAAPSHEEAPAPETQTPPTQGDDPDEKREG